MPIKVEILADTTADLMAQLRGLLAGGQPIRSEFEQALAANQMQAAINAAPAVKPSDLPSETAERIPGNTRKRVRDRSKAALAAKAAANGTNAIKPLPEDDDPLSVKDEPFTEFVTDETEDEDEEKEDGALFAAPTEANLLVTATDKLRDLFKANAKGVAGVRALREKYQVKFFHQVPVDKAQELWADALKLEAEMKA
jgi:hypothetical protein